MSNDPVVRQSPAPSASRNSGRQLADVLGTVALLIAHFVLFSASYMMLGLMVMGTDACAYQKCGDEAWLTRAINLGLWGGGLILLTDLLITLIRLVRQRVAWFVPLIGCIAQLALAFGAAAMESLAGPL